MPSIDQLLKREIDVNTPDQIPDFSVVSSRASSGRLATRFSKARTPFLIAACVVVVAGMISIASLLGQRDDTATPAPATTAGPPANALIVGTWEPVDIRGFDQSVLKEASTKALITFNVDGTWTGSDGCNGLHGEYRVSAEGSFSASSGAQTEIGCANVPNAEVLTTAASIEITADRLQVLDDQGDLLGAYKRPGAPYNPTARLLTDPVRFIFTLELKTFGSSSCPYRIADITFTGPNQLLITQRTDGPTVCTSDISPSTDSIAIPPREIDPGIPLSLTLAKYGDLRDLTIPVQQRPTEPPTTQPVLATATSWDGQSVRTARLTGVLSTNEAGCVTVGGTVVVWPSSYDLRIEDGSWSIVDGAGNVLGSQGQNVNGGGGLGSGQTTGVEHAEECLQGNYWVGILDSGTANTVVPWTDLPVGDNTPPLPDSLANENVRVVVLADGPATEGERYPFTVRLFNDTAADIPLTECPRYYASMAKLIEIRMLNCGQAPAALPAGGYIDFAMEIEAQELGNVSQEVQVVWKLGGPDGKGPIGFATVMLNP